MGAFDWFWKAMGSTSERNNKKSKGIVAGAHELIPSIEQLDDAALAAAIRDTVSDGAIKDKQRFLAILSVASKRTLGLLPFDVQNQAVLRLLEGDVIQMATGEGKTLVGAMAATGFGLTGKRVHVITVNNYLADRDAEWMRPLVEFFGLRVASVTENSSREERTAAYRSDIVYAPVTEIGFDHLRDNQITSRAQTVQAPVDVALVDEADSVLATKPSSPSSSPAPKERPRPPGASPRPSPTCARARTTRSTPRGATSSSPTKAPSTWNACWASTHSTATGRLATRSCASTSPCTRRRY